MKTNNKVIVLLSGGLDSLVSLAAIRNNCSELFALFFNYGQKSFEQEHNAVKQICGFYNIRYELITLDWLKNISQSSLTSSSYLPMLNMQDLDNKVITKKSANSVWVPNRNALFVNIAACYCDALNYNYIVLGANKEEGETFKDNSKNFVNAMNESLKNSANSDIILLTPLIDLTKKEIVEYALKLNVPFEYLHSCYVDNKKNCGYCESCLRLKRALELNNRYDIIDKIFL